MPTIVDVTEEPRQYSPSILKIKEEDEKLIDRVQQEFFLDTLDLRRNIIQYREWYHGIDSDLDKAFGDDPNTDSAVMLPGLTSMIGFHSCEIETANFQNFYFPDSGEYMSVVPKKGIAVASAPKLNKGMNDYLMDNPNTLEEAYRNSRGTCRDGVSFLKTGWDLRNTTDHIPNVALPVFNPKTKTFDNPEETLAVTRKISDRPYFQYVDPLFIGLPRGSKMLNQDANMLVHKEIWYRHQLEELEFQGYIGKKAGGKSFRSLNKDQIGAMHTNYLEAPEVQSYFEELFDTRLNSTLGFSHPHYKVMVDKMFLGTYHKGKVQEIWSINGHIIRKAPWIGGDEIPYTQFNYVLADQSYFGMGALEIIADYFREDNVLTRLGLVAARKEGNTLIFMPQELIQHLGQKNILKFSKTGGIVGIRVKDKEIPLANQIVPVNLSSGVTANFTQARQELRQLAQQYLGISVLQSNTAEVPSALRSKGVIQAFASETSGPTKMRQSLFGNSLTKVYEQLKSLVYFLETGPVEIPANPESSEFVTITREDINYLPFCRVKPAAQSQPVKEATGSLLLQLMQILRGPDGQVAPEVIKMVLEKLLGSEELIRLEAAGAIPQGPVGGAPVGANPEKPSDITKEVAALG